MCVPAQDTSAVPWGQDGVAGQELRARGEMLHGERGVTGTPWCPHWGLGCPRLAWGSALRSGCFAPGPEGGLSIPSPSQVGPRDGGTLGGDPWGAAGQTHGRRHGRGGAGLCPPPRSPQTHLPCPGTQGDWWVLPAPWGWHWGASAAVMGHGGNWGCGGWGGPQMWVLSGGRAHSQPPSLGLTPAQCQFEGGSGTPPSTPFLGGTAGAGGSHRTHSLLAKGALSVPPLPGPGAAGPPGVAGCK